MKTRFDSLQLNVKTIAKLNDDQLSTVRGGNNQNFNAAEEDCTDGGITCSGAGATIIIQTKSE